MDSEQIRVSQKFYNDFYALRLKADINDHPITLTSQEGTSYYLHCDILNVQLPFSSLLRQLKPLLTQYGVSSIVTCFTDPLPLFQVTFNEPLDLRRFLLHIDEISPQIWFILWNGFCRQATSVPLLREEDSEASLSPLPLPTSSIDSLRLQNILCSHNNCQLELYYVSPNFAYKEVKLLQVTLANYEVVTKAVTRSFVFDFHAAMNTFINDRTQYSFKDLVSLEDLKTELKSFSGWFHLGVLTRMPFSTLMGILVNYKHRDVCLSQVLNLWYSRNTDAHGDNQLTWTTVAKTMNSLGRKSIAASICEHYGILIKSFESSEEEVVSAHGRLLSDPKLKEWLKNCNELEGEILEKTKILTLYYRQKKSLKVSLKFLRDEMKVDIDDSYYALQLKQGSERELNKISERIQALKTALRSFHSDSFEEDELLCGDDQEGEGEEEGEGEGEGEKEEGEEEKEKETEIEVFNNLQNTTRRTSQSYDLMLQSKKHLREIFHELIVSKMSQSSDKELAQVRINSLIQQISVTFDKIEREYELLVTKCHQIHQIESALDLLRVELLTHELRKDHFLQLEVARKTKSETRVHKIQRQVIEEEMATKEEATREDDFLSLSSRRASLDEREREEEVAVIEWMTKLRSNRQGSQSSVELNDEQLSQLLEKVEGTMTTQKSLLKAKMSSWNAKRSHRLTAAEQNVLQLILDSLKVNSLDGEDQPDGTPQAVVDEPYSTGTISSNDDREGVLSDSSAECHLSLTESVHVNANKFIKFIVSINEKMKLNPKRFTYTSEIRSLANNSTTNQPMIWDSNNSTLSVVYQPIIRGRHQLSIKVNNKVIKTIKPFAFYVNQNPKLLGFPVRIIDGLNFPYNIQIVPNSSSLLVSECKSRSVTLRDKISGKSMQTIASSATVKLPNGIAIDKGGLVRIVDSASHCVHTFTLEGIQVDKTGSQGEAYSMFYYPYGIQVSPHDGTINICDHCNDRVQIFSSDMKFQKALYAVTPYDIAFDKRGCIYVTDHENHLVGVFNESLQCINSIAGKGTQEGKLLDPRGIGINEEGYIFVAEERNHRISVFNSDGEFVACFGSEGSQPGEFNGPQGVSIDEDGYIYVCDMLNNRIQVF